MPGSPKGDDVAVCEGVCGELAAVVFGAVVCGFVDAAAVLTR